MFIYLRHFFTLTNFCLIFYSVMTPSNIITYINSGKAWGTNFAKWKADLKLILAIMDRDHSFREDKPVAEGDNDTTLAMRITEYEKAKAQ
jgi:hypothetical protein